eukprot:2899074-Amphidinium_carterae.5
MHTDVTGLIHTALSLRIQTAWVCFKQAVEAEIESRPLDILEEAFIPERVVKYKHFLLHLYFDGKGSAIQSALSLLASFNGDWEQPRLQYYWNPAHGPTPSERAIRQLMIECAKSTLCSAKPNVFPTSRWTGFRASLRDIGMWFACHSLMLDIYNRFLGMMRHSKASANARGNQLESSMHAEETHPPILPMDMSVLESGGIEMNWAGVSSVIMGQEESTHELPTLAEVNSRDRSVASTWIQSSPWPNLLLMTVVLRPLERLLQSHFQMASAEFEEIERKEMMKAALSAAVGKRQYRLAVAASMKLEKQCLAELANLFNDGHDVWQFFPEASWTLALQVKAFILMSRVGCLLEHTLFARHSKFPCKLFLLLDQSEAAESLTSVPKCMKDKWTKEVEAKYPTLTEPSLLATLALQASIQPTDISAIEARHASVRRQCVLRSCQTWCACLKQVSANFLLQSQSRALARAKGSVQNKVIVSSRKTPKPRKRKPGRGGTWRAFIRLSTVGQTGSPDLAALAKEYRERKLDGSLQHAEALGKVAKLVAHGSSLQVFKKSRQVLAERKRGEQVAFYEQHKPLNFVQQAVAIQATCANQLSLVNPLQLARAVTKLANAEKRKTEESEQEWVSLYEEQIGRGLVSKLQTTVPDLHPIPFKCIPHVGGLHIYEVLPGRVQELAQRTNAYIAGNKTTNAGVALDNLWQSIHSTVPELSGQDSEARSCVSNAGKEETPCQRAGVCVCVCSEAGKQLQALRNKFLANLKQTFKYNPDKDMLRTGRIVLAICAADAEKHANTHGPDTVTEYYFHVGYISWSPYKPVLHRLLPIYDPRICDEMLDATNMYLTDWKALQELELLWTWQLLFYNIVENQLPLTKLCPAAIPVKRCTAPMVDLWPIVKQPRRKKIATTSDGAEGVLGWGSVVASDGPLPSASNDEQQDEELHDLPPPLEDLTLAEDLAHRTLADLLDEDVPAEIASEDCIGIGENNTGVPDALAHDAISAIASTPCTIFGDVAPAELRKRRVPEVVASSVKFPAEATCVLVGHGRISYHTSKQSFEALCYYHTYHGQRCILTRTAKAGSAGTGTGRPLGFLARWLLSGGCGDRAAHWKKDKWYEFSQVQRHDARSQLADLPGGQDLLALERQRHASEPEEPASLAGLV